MKNGKNIEWTTDQTYPEKNLKWAVSFTHDISSINITYLALALQE